MFWCILLLKLLLISEFCKNSALISFVQVPVSFCDLFDGVSDQVGDHHKIRSEVDEHGYKRVAQIMDAYRLYSGFIAVGTEHPSDRVVRKRAFAAEKERGPAGIVL